MTYWELAITPKPAPILWDRLVAELAEIGFESFTEEKVACLAYAPDNEFNRLATEKLLSDLGIEDGYTFKAIEAQNWNATWEEQFEPVVVNKDCIIRGPFHAKEKAYAYDIEISPRMSFGTGHHATTKLMCQQMFAQDFKGKAVLDMGCGTGVLAILAHKLGASKIVAIDIESNAANNCLENFKANLVNGKVKCGDATAIGDEQFDIVLANINRNIIIKDIAAYQKALLPGGLLFLSGFLQVDKELINACLTEMGFTLVNTAMAEHWMCMVWRNNLFNG